MIPFRKTLIVFISGKWTFGSAWGNLKDICFNVGILDVFSKIDLIRRKIFQRRVFIIRGLRIIYRPAAAFFSSVQRGRGGVAAGQAPGLALPWSS